MSATLTNTDLVLRKDTDGIAELTLNRPHQYNALSMEMLTAILEQLNDIKNDETIKVMILKKLETIEIEHL